MDASSSVEVGIGFSDAAIENMTDSVANARLLFDEFKLSDAHLEFWHDGGLMMRIPLPDGWYELCDSSSKMIRMPMAGEIFIPVDQLKGYKKGH